MKHLRRLPAVLLVLAVVATACSSGDDSDDGAATSTSAGTAGGGAGGSVSGPEVEAALAWVDGTLGLDPAVRSSLVAAEVEQVGQVAHVTFEQVYDGVPVDGGVLIVHVPAEGTPSASNELTGSAPAGEGGFSIDEATALDNAGKAVTGTVGEASAEQVWVEAAGQLVPAWVVRVHTTDPIGDWVVTIDATNGAVLDANQEEAGRRPHADGLVAGLPGSGAGSKAVAQTRQTSPDRCTLPAAPSACIFLVDPIYASGGQNIDAATANQFLTPVTLEGLTDPSSGVLDGEFATVETPLNPIPSTPESDGRWGAGRGDRGFEAQNSYYWIDYGQRLVQRLGFSDMLNRSFPIVPLDPDTFDNAYYSPGQQAVFMGTGTTGGGINEGEDASGILHEYGHALLDAVNPDLLGGGDTGAYHEGFGDIFAYLATLELRTGDAECFFIWTDQECLRRMDTDRVYPADLVNAVHADGMIYTGAIYDVLAALLADQGIDVESCPGTDACGEVRDRVLTTVLASNYYLTPTMRLPDIAAAYLQANADQYGGADADLIEAAFAEHGLTGGGSGTVVDPDGNATGTEALAAVEVEISHSYRGDLLLEVGVADADGNDLCTVQTLFTPDSGDDADNVSGYVDLSDTDCASLVPPSPDQRWYAYAEDTLAEDEGTFVSFTVWADGVPYPAPGLPIPIADADPAGTFAVVDGSTSTTQGNTSGFDTPDGSAPYISAAITHTYQGDLAIRAGVADATGTILCSVSVLESNASDSTSGTLSGDIDMAACESYYPPAPDQRWYLHVMDTAAVDEGTVDLFTVYGPDGSVHDFGDVPVAVPDADVDGIVLLLDGSTGTSGQAGGGGQGGDLPLPAASLSITHTYAGDLVVLGGVADATGRSLCEVVLHTSDPNDDSVDLAGDVSLAECSQYYPPSADRQWYLSVTDTLSVDEGTLDSFVLTGPDGVVYTATDAPTLIPDADPTGVTWFLDGDEAANTGMLASVLITHPYVGDLDVYVGVADADGDVLCEIQAAVADVSNDGADFIGDVQLDDCEAYYPPSPSTRWFVQAIDNFAYDVGTIDAFTLIGPDGAVYLHPDVPLAIPDEDTDGSVLFFDGSIAPVTSGGGSGDGSGAVATVGISHPYSGDLDVYVGVADAQLNTLCEVQLVAADASYGEPDLFGDFDVSDCASYYPPSPSQLWYLVAVDTLSADEGSIVQFGVTGPDGVYHDALDVPVAIPDADLDGAASVVDS